MSLMDEQDVRLHYVDTLADLEIGQECMTLSLARSKGGRAVPEIDLIIPIGAMRKICEQMHEAMQRSMAS